jgi:hypothetical protein
MGTYSKWGSVSGLRVKGTVAAVLGKPRRYVRDWLLLPEALTLVKALAGIAEEEAKTDICLALNDGNIAVRIRTMPIDEILIGPLPPGGGS